MNDERLQKAAHAAVRSYIVARIIDDYAAGALDPKANIYTLPALNEALQTGGLRKKW